MPAFTSIALGVMAATTMATGAMAASKAGRSGVSTIGFSPATPEEQRFRALEEATQRATIQQAGYNIKENPDGTITLVPGPMEETESKIRALSNKRLLDYLEGKIPEIPPQSRALVEQQYGAALTSGEQELEQFAQDLAASRGMSVTDTPIGSEVLRERGLLGLRLGGAKAGAMLDVASSQRQFDESIRQFQEGLRQRSFLNRLSLTQMPSMSAMLSQGRFAAPTTSFTAPFSDIAPALMRGLGSGMTGAAMLSRPSSGTGLWM